MYTVYIHLKLHNPSKLTVQEIQVDIVNAHETLVQDLLPVVQRLAAEPNPGTS